jgi:hypothetical protein
MSGTESFFRRPAATLTEKGNPCSLKSLPVIINDSEEDGSEAKWESIRTNEDTTPGLAAELTTARAFV